MQNKECCTPQKNRINYQKELEKLLASLEAERISGNGKKKRLLLHACCALQQLCAGISERKI